MYKYVYVPETVLAYPLLYGSALLRVPVLLYSRLSTILFPGDWTYLRISQSCRTEIVKIIGLVSPDTCIVVRHLDGTEEEVFTEGAIIDSTATTLEVLDSYWTNALQLFGGGAIQVDGTHLSYIPFTIQLEGPLQLIGGDSIGRIEGAYGGCSGGDGVSLVPVRPIYLTSKIYPLDVIEEMQAGADLRGGRHNTAPLDNIQVDTTITGGTLRAVLQTYNNAQPDTMTSGSSLLSGTIVTVLHSYSNWPQGVADESIQSGAYLLSGSIATVLIQYQNWPLAIASESMQSAASIQSGTLT